ncbi:hypothetical protein FQ377_13575 [Arthrobacter echini]|uniref:Uncharacterized protein n=1 Tax=Arthrobacter echini TaxID=1529066 RepID=A0A5D0XJH2_9MICC|nr:hypothetical protein [Arthrobacter echini]TYC96617.1 hypothetical protein FQ377_13575 [Arthrobacter echini]
MTTIENVEAQARELLNSRITSVRDLVTARQRMTDLQAQLADAERENKKAYIRATKDGWSEDELKKLGLDNNAAPGRRRQARKTGTGTGDTAPAEGTEA